MCAAAAFYEPLGESRFRATEATMSPWDRRLQHGGPPAALAVAALEHTHPRPDMRVARIAIDMLGPMPIGDYHAQSRVVRPGRKVELLETTLEHEGRTTLVARAWRIAFSEVSVEGLTPKERAYAPPPLPPADDRQFGFTFGYAEAVEMRFASGRPDRAGPAVVWMRPRIPLLGGQPLRPLQRLLICADSANGVSAEMPFSDWLFVPPSLTVNLLRYPSGDWICLDAKTAVAADGVGLTESILADANGFVGAGAQPLFIERRVAVTAK